MLELIRVWLKSRTSDKIPTPNHYCRTQSYYILGQPTLVSSITNLSAIRLLCLIWEDKETKDNLGNF